jgi:superfamily I DNA/RNA helicase
VRAAKASGAGVGERSVAALLGAADQAPGVSLLDLAVDAPLEELGPKRRAALRHWASALQQRGAAATVAEQARQVLVASGQPDRLHRALESGRSADVQLKALDALQRLRDLVRMADDYQRDVDEPALADFVATVALGSSDRPPDADAVSLLTVHRAKGLEFAHVWIAGLEEGLFPHARAIQEAGEGEERRLAYVAMTRAKRTLTASWARSRRGLAQQPSRFLNGL